MRCMGLEAKPSDAAVIPDVLQLQICFCVDSETGEKIPLTDKAVLGDQDKPDCSSAEILEEDYLEVCSVFMGIIFL